MYIYIYISCNVNVEKARVTSRLKEAVRLGARYFAGEEPLTPDRVRWASKARPRVAGELVKSQNSKPFFLTSLTHQLQQSATGSIPVTRCHWEFWMSSIVIHVRVEKLRPRGRGGLLWTDGGHHCGRSAGISHQGPEMLMCCHERYEMTMRKHARTMG